MFRIELTSEKEQIFVSLLCEGKNLFAVLALFKIMLVPGFNYVMLTVLFPFEQTA